KQVGLARNHHPIRVDSVDRKLADNGVKLMRGAKHLNAGNGSADHVGVVVQNRDHGLLVGSIGSQQLNEACAEAIAANYDNALAATTIVLHLLLLAEHNAHDKSCRD